MSAPSATLSPLDPPPGDELQRARKGKKRIVILFIVAAVVAGGFAIYRHLTHGVERTDDAQVEADVVPLAVRVSGQIRSIGVVDNGRVEAGQVILELDRAELDARVKQAKAELDAAQAQADGADAHALVAEAGAQGGKSGADAQVATAQAQVRTASSGIIAAQAQTRRAATDLAKAERDLKRAKGLTAQGAMTQERLDAAQAARDSAAAEEAQAKAQLAAAQSARNAATAQVAAARGNVEINAPVDARVAEAKAAAVLAHAHVDDAQAALDLAQLARSYATVVAPHAGTVANLNVHPGQLVTAGQTIAQVVPDETYVVANFKETQLEDIRPGQSVDLEADAFPGTHLSGVVESLAGGTGSRFSLLPPDNASGNFVKVVQRVRVRIRWQALPKDLKLRAGMSVDVTVHTGS
jgi:membrane fusion protein (multidrug efflux system)